MSNSSRKGSSFERKICKKLSLWWSDGKRDDIFYRASGSGARATSRHRKGKETANAEGDVCYTDKEGADLLKIVCIELKCGYKEWSVLDDLETKQTVTQFDKFWNQVTESAEHAEAMPFLIYKKDRKLEMCVFPKELFRFMDLGICSSFNYAMIRNESLVCMRLDDFLKYITPDDFRRML